MGRPKGSKNKITVVKSDITETKSTINNKIVCTCDLCGKSLYCSPTIIRLNSFTGMASWHRSCKIEKLNLCNSCAEELNNTVDNFILKKNPQLNRYS